MEAVTWEVVIIGGGPAGLSAALLLGRARRRVLVLDTGSPRNRFAAHMHGVLGNEGLPPGELLRRGRAEAAGYGIAFRDQAVELVEETADGIRVVLADGEAVTAPALVVASGLSDELPDVPGLAERWGSSVLHCPYCHGWEFRDRRLGVLTTSPTGWHQAELVRQWSEDVVVFTAGAGEPTAEQERRLRARGIRLIASPVVEVLGDGGQVTAVRTADGETVELDALYTAGAPRPRDGFLAGLGLARTDAGLLAVDTTGRTSNGRVWAAGNVVAPAANVPVSIAAGSMAAGAVNLALIAAEFDAAELEAAETAATAAEPRSDVPPADYWEHRYADAERMWSGRVNAVLADVAAGLRPGIALDLGCGEGADVLWLAEHGWIATGVDISPTAIERARAAARAAGVPEDRARFLVADLAELAERPDDDRSDLVTASFLHSPVELPRGAILRAAAARVAPGGHLLITSHAAFPSWSAHAEHGPDAPRHRLLSPGEEIAGLGLDPGEWDTVTAETRPRRTASPDGGAAVLDDAIVLLRRR